MTSSSNMRLVCIPRMQLWPTINLFSEERRSITWRNPTAALIFISAILWCSFFTSSYRRSGHRRRVIITCKWCHTKCSSQIHTSIYIASVSNFSNIRFVHKMPSYQDPWHEALCFTFSFFFSFLFFIYSTHELKFSESIARQNTEPFYLWKKTNRIESTVLLFRKFSNMNRWNSVSYRRKVESSSSNIWNQLTDPPHRCDVSYHKSFLIALWICINH